MPYGKKELQLPKKPLDKVTLYSFMEENHKVITVIGVFTALTVFTANLTLRPMALILSFLFMTLTIILWLELLGRFPSKGGGWRMYWFENILSFAAFSLLAYWLLAFRAIWKTMLVVLVFGLVLHSLSAAMKRFNVFNRIFHAMPGRKRSLRYVVWLVIMIVSGVVAFGIGALLTPWINRWLDVITKNVAV